MFIIFRMFFFFQDWGQSHGVKPLTWNSICVPCTLLFCNDRRKIHGIAYSGYIFNHGMIQHLLTLEAALRNSRHLFTTHKLNEQHLKGENAISFISRPEHVGLNGILSVAHGFGFGIQCFQRAYYCFSALNDR